ncbi:MAG: hypothetical protein U0350_25525 [Caldilineaceae bacterium]
MPQQNSEAWTKARLAQEKLIAQFLNHPAVTLIDIGQKPAKGQAPEQLAVRIHVCADWFKAKLEERVAFPQEVDGVPVLVLPGDYQPET